jgi:hypothetical protein
VQIEDLLQTYQKKSDEELIQLAGASDQLTSAAQLALQSELSRRHINIERESEISEADKHPPDVGLVSTEELGQTQDRQGVADFVAEVLRTYHNYFWLFFKITAPAVSISTIAFITGTHEIWAIVRHLHPGHGRLAYGPGLIEASLIRLFSLFVSWMAFSFSFAAICIALEGAKAGYTPSASHSVLNVRERLGTFFRLSSLLFALMLLLMAASFLLQAGAFWALQQLRVPSSYFLTLVVIWITIGLGFLVLSRFALAVPAVVLDDCRVGQAMFRSHRLTQGKWLTLAALLGKSIIGSYIAGKLPFWLASFIPSSLVPSWFPFSWGLTVASIVGVTVVEPPMFIGFALLYLKMSASDPVRPKVLASSTGVVSPIKSLTPVGSGRAQDVGQ